MPVPKPLIFCKDPSVVGTPFYVMQHVAGRIFLDQALPGMRPEERRAAYGEMARVLAALHSAKPAQVGLAGFGKGENYASRCATRGLPDHCACGAASICCALSKQTRASVAQACNPLLFCAPVLCVCCVAGKSRPGRASTLRRRPQSRWTTS